MAASLGDGQGAGLERLCSRGEWVDAKGPVGGVELFSAGCAAVKAGAEVVPPLTDEPWGVRRFFVRDPDGHVLNILSHR